MKSRELPRLSEISLHILDIATNSVDAGASLVSIEIDEDDEKYAVTIADDGVGMPAEILGKAADMGFSTKPGNSGLGLFLLKKAAERTSGSFFMESRYEKEYPNSHGTTVRAVFMKGGAESLPMGDIASTLESLVTASPAADISFTHTKKDNAVRFDTREIKKRVLPSDTHHKT